MAGNKSIGSHLLYWFGIFFVTLCCTDLPASENRQGQVDMQELLRETFPESYAQLSARYGLRKVAGGERCRQSPVILVHGLDDPGTIWGDLVPQLEEQGYCAYIFNYPNDQPIRNSAYFLAAQLQKRVAELGPEVMLAAHSMGGLVSREMLTNPAIGYRQRAAKHAMPRVRQLIMVGTPNHGSVFARLRFVLEIADQAISALEGDFNLLRMFVDGMGEAGVDLYPGSAFLTELNARRPPPGVRMMIVAGVDNPWPPQAMAALLDLVKELVPEGFDFGFRAYEPELRAAMASAGDGLVSLSSVGLPEVPMIKVPANHISMIRRLPLYGNAQPPAIPVILKALAENR